MVLQLLEAGMMLLKLNHRHSVKVMMIGKEKGKVLNQEELLISIIGAAPKTQASMRIVVDLSVRDIYIVYYSLILTCLMYSSS